VSVNAVTAALGGATPTSGLPGRALAEVMDVMPVTTDQHLAAAVGPHAVSMHPKTL
jgi:hypothetical protein